MTDEEMITKIQAKITRKFRLALKSIDQTGECGREINETLWLNGLIQFGGPRPEIDNPYNCYRLTDDGKQFLNAS